MSIYELGETNPSYEQDSIDVFEGSSDVTETTFINDDDSEKIEPVKTPEADSVNLTPKQKLLLGIVKQFFLKMQNMKW